MSYAKLRFEHLSIFISLLQIGSFSECAKLIGKSQGTISNVVNDIEESLGGVELIIRNSKTFEVTEFGRMFASYAQDVLNRTSAIYSEFQQMISSESPTYEINIASSSMPGEFILPKHTIDFTKDKKNVKINLDISNSLSALNLLLNNKVNFAAVGGFFNYNTDYFDMIEIGHDDIELATAKKSPIFKEIEELSQKNPNLTSEDLMNVISKYTFISREKASATKELYYEKFPAIKDLKVEMEFSNNASLIQSIISTNAISIISSLFLEKSPFGDLLGQIKHPKIPVVSRKFYFVKLKDKKLPPIDEEFWKHVASKSKA